MRKRERPKRPRSATGPHEEVRFDIAALCLAAWLGMMVLAKCVTLLPSLPELSPAMDGDYWGVATLGT